MFLLVKMYRILLKECSVPGRDSRILGITKMGGIVILYNPVIFNFPPFHFRQINKSKKYSDKGG